MDTVTETVPAQAGATQAAGAYVQLPDCGRIDAGCNDENTRFAIAGTLLTGRKGKPVYAVSTNGKMLAIVPTLTEAPYDLGSIVSADVVAAAYKPGRGKLPAMILVRPTEEGLPDTVAIHPRGHVSKPAIEGQFPPFLDVLPDVNGAQHNYRAIGLDLEHLSKCSKALGTSKLVILVDIPSDPDNGPTKPYVILPNTASGDGVPGAIAVLMPFVTSTKAAKALADAASKSVTASCSRY